jgi:hypothetical protein
MPFTLHDKLALLTVAEDAAWEDLLRQARLRRHLVHIVSPRAVLLEAQAVEPLLKALLKNGHLPRVVS